MTPAPISMSFFNAKPDRGAILPYHPVGRAIARPIFTKHLPCISITVASAVARSYPATPLVPLTGNLAFTFILFTVTTSSPSSFTIEYNLQNDLCLQIPIQ